MPERVSAFAPGRVNLIGEHTDYNHGLALPFAIGLGITVEATPLAGDHIEAIATDLGERDEFPVAAPERPTAGGWRSFVRGAVAELAAAGRPPRPARLEISGTLPPGAGLSSSAALEVALCLALLAAAGVRPPGRLELARICSRIENEWAGARTGLLDQLASLYGEPGRALRIDFASLEVTPVPLDLPGCRLVVLDSGGRHDHGSVPDGEGYNQRRAECARACELLGVPSLRDASLTAAARLPPPLDARVRHVVTENARVEATIDALVASDAVRVGALLNESHASLRDEYDISTPGVERAVGALLEAGALGARIVGGGFGGNVLGLLPAGARPPAGARDVAPSAGASY